MVTIGPHRLFLGDGLEALGECDFDAIVTDPPYGIGYLSNLPGAARFSPIVGDDGSLDLAPVLAAPVPVLSFGANNYPAQLPHRGRWLCWDKRTPADAAAGMLGSAFELAWANKRSGFDKIVRVLHGGVVNADGGKRFHPTQKPRKLMVEAIRWAAPNAEVIIDPFMGSGSTGLAAISLGRRFLGVEVAPEHFSCACERIAEAVSQPDLFVSPPRAASDKQQALGFEEPERLNLAKGREKVKH